MIYTSYFAKYKEGNGISIARFSPNWFKGETCRALAPSENLLRGYKNGEISEKEYRKEFITQLNKLDVHLYYLMLNNKVLLCFEKPESFCHRHIVREWFKRNGYEVEEL